MENLFFFIYAIIILTIIICLTLVLLTPTVIRCDTHSKSKKRKKLYTDVILFGLVVLSGLTTQQLLTKYCETPLVHQNKTETNKYENIFDYQNKIEKTFDHQNEIETSKYENTFDHANKINISNIININNDTTDRSPIMIIANENMRLIPNRDGDISLPIGAKVCFYCTPSGFKTTSGNKIEAEFLGDQKFSFNGETQKFSEFECKDIPMPTSKYKDDLIEFTYDLNDGKSIPVMTLSFDRNNYTTLYVKYKIYPATMNCKKKVKGKEFTADPQYFDNINIKNSLKLSKVEKEFCEILNYNSDEIKIYLNDKQRITRGHMAPKFDFIFSGDQKSTYNHLNVCFQWTSVNNCNCSAIEEGIRAYSNESNAIFTCYSGSMGVCTLPDRDGVPKELYIKCNNDVKIPVPKFIYRIVINDERCEGIVFLSINNPHLEEDFDVEEYVIGNDVGNQIEWIKWDRKNIKKGYSYAISVPDFIAAAKDFPLKNLNTTGLLGVQSI
uniref:DNA/RNA non-specific endonuclease/pyrophosphatase/phosphodiesterase domain-containing protein n=1 Tax=Ceratitis capitata TaxID=7213 RepID=W8C1G5_CERCA